jgi:hypothetical protein
MTSLLENLGIRIEVASWRNPVPHVWSVHIRDAESPMCFTNGKGATKNAALASALGEYLERISTNYFYSDYYLGEEIIYYRDKTETQFLQCTREMFDTTSSFEKTANSGDIQSEVTYIIKTLGSVNWKDYGAPDGYAVGTIFTATSDGSGTTESGEVILFESNLTPFSGSNYAIHSYQRNNYLSQFWPISIQNKAV